MISISLSSCNVAIFRLACAISHIPVADTYFRAISRSCWRRRERHPSPGGQTALAAVGSLLVAAVAATAAGGRATAGLGGGGGSSDAGLPAFWWPVSRLATAS